MGPFTIILNTYKGRLYNFRGWEYNIGELIGKEDLDIIFKDKIWNLANKLFDYLL